jgi:hypothetical protein
MNCQRNKCHIVVYIDEKLEAIMYSFQFVNFVHCCHYLWNNHPYNEVIISQLSFIKVLS